MNKTTLRSLAASLAFIGFTAQAQAVNPIELPLGAFATADRMAQQRHTATGPVTGIADGDTFYMAIEGKPTRLRLAQIDAPEKAQPFGRRAEQSLRDLIGKRQVTVTWTQADRYGRPIVQVQADGQDVNAEQVRRGYAWVYRQYATDRSLFALEDEARSQGRGLWADLHPVPPWEWRKEHPKADR